uniref:G-patch domain-containing protein n=1 Tax=Ditylenchus dipsaci TaxID=166011 RepID=A0A915D271_9BILA
MYSQSKNLMATLYGTAFEQLSDEERDAITKKPKVISEEVVTDEKGRRRFHGAFTGGFSAGYFNTAGSKHGWVPQTFKSSRESRAENAGVSAEDFMDEEDLGEFGIAAKSSEQDRILWILFLGLASPFVGMERSTNVLPSTSAANEDDSVTSKLSELLRPLNDSIGVRLLKKMGWREGKGIGLRMSRRALEKQKVIDAVSRGEAAVFDEEAVAEVENRAHQVDFARMTSLHCSLTPKKMFMVLATILFKKECSRSKLWRAFGVGAFEEDDEDIYTSYDLSQYDFEIGQSASSGVKETARFDSTFVPAKKSASSARKFFPGIKPPSNFRRTRGSSKVSSKPKPAEYEPFEEEPIKAHRFKKYVSYLKRWIYFEQPVELTRLEWGQQLAEFQNALTPSLFYLKSVRDSNHWLKLILPNRSLSSSIPVSKKRVMMMMIRRK